MRGFEKLRNIIAAQVCLLRFNLLLRNFFGNPFYNKHDIVFGYHAIVKGLLGEVGGEKVGVCDQSKTFVMDDNTRTISEHSENILEILLVQLKGRCAISP